MQRKHYLYVGLPIVLLLAVLLVLTADSRGVNARGQPDARRTLVQRVWDAITGQARGDVGESQRRHQAAGIPAGATVAGATAGSILSASDAIAAASRQALLDKLARAGATHAATDEIAAATHAISGATEATQRAPAAEETRAAEAAATQTAVAKSEPTPTPRGVGGVQGRVRGREHGSPLAGVTVRVFGDSGLENAAAVTDRDGAYSIEGLSVGTYRIEARAHAQSARSVQIEPNTTITVDFELPEGATIAGRVRNHLGQPVAEALLRLLNAETEERLSETRSAADGAYVLTNAALGGQVRVVATHEAYAPQFKGPFVVYEMATDGVDLVLHPGTTLTGYVRDKQNRGIAGARLEARPFGTWNPNASGEPFESPMTDSSGFFRFNAMPAGGWELRANATGYATGRQTVTLHENVQHPDVIFILERSGAGVVEGVVVFRGAPVAAAEVTLHGNGREDTTVTDHSGRFQFSGVSDGVYIVVARHRSYSPGHRDVQPGGEAITIELQPVATLALRVVDANNAPVLQYDVTMRPQLAGFMIPEGQVEFATVQDADGQARWQVVLARYDVTVSAPGYRTAERKGHEGLQADENGTLHVVRLEGGAVLPGYVQDANTNQPIRGVRLEWYSGHVDVPPGHLGPIMGPPGGTTTSNTSGYFVFNDLPANAITVVAHAPGYSRWVDRSINMQSPPDYLLVRLRPGGVLSGRILHEGVAFQDAEIELESLDNPGTITGSWATRSDTQGRFSFEGVTPGSYLVRVRRFYRGSTLWRRFPLTVESANAQVELWLPGGEISIAVTNPDTGGLHSRGPITLRPVSVQPYRGRQVLLPDPLLTLNQTDGAGRFTFVCLPAGQYILSGTAGGGGDSAVVLPDRPLVLGEDEKLRLEY